ncbi:MAG: DUF6133 family protein [Hungatella hathewayi]|nr:MULTISPECIES: DUF6133 family protein [Hungatella]MCI7380752.1 DUF6133 family protein [Hungatella sp.]MDY6235746.1 DUF6133 family protein [Hungatella hathewayi]
MKEMKNSIKLKAKDLYVKTRYILSDKRGEGYIDTAIVILISVVLGALLLAGLYALFGDVVLPELVRRIQEMFNYAG